MPVKKKNYSQVSCVIRCQNKSPTDNNVDVAFFLMKLKPDIRMMNANSNMCQRICKYNMVFANG